MPWLERSKGGGVSATLSASSTKIDEAYLHLNTLSNDKQTFISPKEIDIHFGGNYPESQLNVKTDGSINYFPTSPGLTTCKLTIKHSDGAISTASFKHGANEKSPLGAPRINVTDVNDKVAYYVNNDARYQCIAFLKDEQGRYTEPTYQYYLPYAGNNFGSRPFKSNLIMGYVLIGKKEEVDVPLDDDIAYLIRLRSIYKISKPHDLVDREDGSLIKKDIRWYSKADINIEYGDPLWTHHNFSYRNLNGNLSQEPNIDYKLWLLTSTSGGGYLIFNNANYLTIPNSGGVEFRWASNKLLKTGDNTPVMSVNNCSFIGGAVIKEVDGQSVAWRPLEGNDFFFDAPYSGDNSGITIKFNITRDPVAEMSSFPAIDATTRLYAKGLSSRLLTYIENDCGENFDWVTEPYVSSWSSTELKDDDIPGSDVQTYREISVKKPYGAPDSAELFFGVSSYSDKMYNLTEYLNGRVIKNKDLSNWNAPVINIPSFGSSDASENMLASKTLTTDLAFGSNTLKVKAGEEISMEVDTSDDRISGANVKLWIGVS
jgi:hypothetical protein